MSNIMTVEEISTNVMHLSTNDLDRFRAWYETFEASNWDKKIEKDIISGKFDTLANEALKDFNANKNIF
ncbi:MAG: hypothetical protein KAH77_05380 [Thiomargarita sp.]|nr:hypothetical protein [Thiomargarita sp.]